MALTFRGVNGLAPATNVTSQNPPKFASQASGDLIFTECFVSAVRTLSITAGWEILFQANNGSMTYGIAFKVAANTTETPTWSWSGGADTLGSNNWDFAGQWSGGRPIGATNFTGPTASQTTISNTIGNITSDGAEVVAWHNAFNNQTVPVPSGFTSLNNFSGASASERVSKKTTTANHGDSVTATATVTTVTVEGSLVEIRMAAPVAVRPQVVIIR